MIIKLLKESTEKEMEHCRLNNKISIIKLLCVIMITGVLSGCNPTPSPTISGKPEKPVLDTTSCVDFSKGMSTFYDNYTKMKTYIIDSFLFADQNEGLLKDEKQRTYYENLMLLMSITDVELSFLKEYDLLEVTTDYSDRAEGNLVLSGYYGYKIKNNSGLKFGCQGSGAEPLYSAAGELEENRNMLTMNISEKIHEDILSKTVIEIVIADENTFVLRAAKNVTDSKTGNSVTKTAYILMKNGTATIAYYEGGAALSSYIALNMLVDYNMNALSFGVGTVMSFDFAL